MKVHELITRLQNFPMDADVYCLHESSDWIWNGEQSTEITTIEEGLVETVMPKIPGEIHSIIIS